ncbi:hypothetical protein HZI56_06695 [Lactobacillus salivarius]|uniref:hypothetical protein n=1 Tax=Ligilactobacillus salivarius TaxID=1624 RepID=UPI0015C61599|nr:hypothetical protein [Ligilactobacillus salivarius]NXZ96772.1 hypothetical protein [Ligilactobacillus salivarius]NYA58948.1 hypothetical protein [Ligilactobacillus salivarius]NYA61527.1 hypothetical protein [Ligilactobacillus salivarius]NYA63751.1 hypothetical protein [Ligilactobacillus salivarius]NYA64521.1 hypothetical protein [Ligilactobacillus salivarius]
MKYLETNEAMPAKVGSYKGYKYYIIPSLFGALNGYAELPKSWKDGDEDELTVHGGITFKGYVRDGASKVKVIGFDTLHAFDDQETWDLKSVEKECKYMIDEMIEVWYKHRPLRANTETALKTADELRKLLRKQGLSFDELGNLNKK